MNKQKLLCMCNKFDKINLIGIKFLFMREHFLREKLFYLSEVPLNVVDHCDPRQRV